VRYVPNVAKLSLLDLPDYVYKVWFVHYFSGHSHCTLFHNQISELENITASIIQGSAIGPAAYVVNAGDLKAITFRNFLCKYADDTYFIVPASNESSRSAELNNIQSWAQDNNLQLNRACQVLVYVLFDRRRWMTLTHSQLYRPYSGCRQSFIIAFDFNSLKIQLRLIGVTFWAAMAQKFFPTQTEV